jgi:hypothetical protein
MNCAMSAKQPVLTALSGTASDRPGGSPAALPPQEGNVLAAKRRKSKNSLSSRLYLFVGFPALLLAGASVANAQQYPILDQIAHRVVQKYQQSSCEQLWQQRGQPKSPREQEAVQALRNDPQMRAVFIDKVAAPIANKLFECGLIP